MGTPESTPTISVEAINQTERSLNAAGWRTLEAGEAPPSTGAALTRCTTDQSRQPHFLLFLSGSLVAAVRLEPTEQEFRSQASEIRQAQLMPSEPAGTDPVPFQFQVFGAKIRSWDFLERPTTTRCLDSFPSPTALGSGLRTSFRLTSLTFSSGQRIELEPSSIVILVGPNNSGKSSTLQEIVAHVQGRRPVGPALRGLEYKLRGNTELLRSWLAETLRSSQTPAGTTYNWINFSADENSLRGLWEKIPSAGLQSLAEVFCCLIKTEDRLTIAKTSSAHKVYQQAPQNPIQSLFEDEDLEKRISEKCRLLFGHEVILNRGGGALISLHFGPRPRPTSAEDRVSRSYVERLVRLPRLEKQGDGIRSFMGTLLLALTSPAFIRLIDEPEAFLHPPQARHLGAILASDMKAEHAQLVVATHSGDLVRGLLESQPERLKILRLSRVGDGTTASELSAADIEQFWSDPSLRFSNTLDGLFHEAVVVCEDDADCRFYSALVESIVDESAPKRPDIMYTACGGKHKIAKVVPALTQAGVPTFVIVDFDVLNDENVIKSIVEKLGRSWSGMQRDWKVLSSAISSRSASLNKNQVSQKVKEILAALPTQKVTQDAANGIRDVLRQVSAWETVKKSGLSAVPQGDASKAATSLLSKLKQAGVFVVPCGEMESFVRSISGHGAAWVFEALDRDVRRDVSLVDARRFASGLLQHITSALHPEQASVDAHGAEPKETSPCADR